MSYEVVSGEEVEAQAECAGGWHGESLVSRYEASAMQPRRCTTFHGIHRQCYYPPLVYPR
jgi:hypothetical protein